MLARGAAITTVSFLCSCAITSSLATYASLLILPPVSPLPPRCTSASVCLSLSLAPAVSYPQVSVVDPAKMRGNKKVPMLLNLVQFCFRFKKLWVLGSSRTADRCNSCVVSGCRLHERILSTRGRARENDGGIPSVSSVGVGSLTRKYRWSGLCMAK